MSLQKDKSKFGENDVIVVDAHDALRILHTRVDYTRYRAHVNLCGTVTCISEIINIKNISLFLIRFTPEVIIIIKMKEFLSWKELLVPYQEYVITNLRATTLEQGGTKPCRVYTVTGKSCLLARCTVSTHFLSASEWLDRHFHHTGLEALTNHAENLCAAGMTDNTGPGHVENLYSYKGKVTRILDQSLGVYEIDQVTRLYVGTIPASHKFSMLQVGQTVTICNAHFQMSNQIPTLTLYCCMLSSITLEENRSDITSQVRMRQSVTIQQNLFLTLLTQNQLQFMYEIRRFLSQHFRKCVSQGTIEDIFTTIMKTSSLSWARDNLGKTRNLLDEFINIPHYCGIQKPGEQISLRYKSISQILGATVETENKQEGWQFKTLSSVHGEILCGVLDTDSKTGQAVLRDHAGSINIILCGCRSDRPQVDCVHSCCETCKCNDLEPGTALPCPFLHTCCLGKVVAVQQYLAVHETKIQPRGCNFTILRGDGSSVYSTKINSYLFVDLRNVVYLGGRYRIKSALNRNLDVKVVSYAEKKSTCGKSCQVLACNRHLCRLNFAETCAGETKIASENARHNVSNICEGPLLGKGYVKADSRTVSFGRKETLNKITNAPLAVSDMQPSNLAWYSRTADNTRFILKDKERTRKYCSDLFRDDNVQGPGVSDKVNSCNDPTLSKCTNFRKIDKSTAAEKDTDMVTEIAEGGMVDCNDVNKRTEVEDCDININQMENEDPDCHAAESMEIQNAIYDTAEVILVQNKDTLMNIGYLSDIEQLRFLVHCQVLSQTSGQAVLLFRGRAIRWFPLLYPGSVYRCSVAGNRPVFSMKLSNEKLKRALEVSKTSVYMDVDPDVEIELFWGQIKECTDMFLNIEGCITERTDLKSDNEDRVTYKAFSYDGYHSRIQVEDRTGLQVKVYLNERVLCLPIGLVPGAHVIFTQLERRITQSGNIYCRFIPLSGVHIKCFHSHLTINSSQSKNKFSIEHPTLKLLLLKDAWQLKTKAYQFMCICDVFKVSNVSLKCVCMNCKSMIVKGACTNITCGGGGQCRFVARATIIVDDSSSLAMVYMYGNTVQRMLRLSDQQWQCLQQEVTSFGEVFVQQMKQEADYENAIERFMYRLCDNWQVKQRWKMVMKTRWSMKNIDDICYKDLQMKTFRTHDSMEISTYCLPYLNLECVALEMFNPTEFILDHLLKSESISRNVK